MKVTIPASTEFVKSDATATPAVTGSSLNHFTTPTDFALVAATYAGTGVASDSTLSTGGVVGFKVAKANWGGSCCAGSPIACEDDNSLAKCNLGSGNLGLFMSNTANYIAHAAKDFTAVATAADKVGSKSI